MAISKRGEDEFRERIAAERAAIGGAIGYKDPFLFSIGARVFTADGTIASVRYPVVNGIDPETGKLQNAATAVILAKVCRIAPGGVHTVELTLDHIHDALQMYGEYLNDAEERHANIEVLREARTHLTSGRKGVVASLIYDDLKPVDVHDGTNKIYGSSCGLLHPRRINLKEIFKVLPNVAWDGDKPMDVKEVNDALMSAAFGGPEFSPHAVDKFPLYAHRINALKMGVRIGHSNAVRLGARLGRGTTMMYGAYANYSAETEGAAMVEGLLPTDSVLGGGSDVGNGARMLGVLSGGNSEPITVGRNCLLGENSSLGISIGDATTIAAAVGVMASSKFKVMLPGHPLHGKKVKAIELSGINGVTFLPDFTVRRLPNNEEAALKLENGQGILNADLHTNQ